MTKIISKRRREEVHRQLSEELDKIGEASAELSHSDINDEWIEHILDQTTRGVDVDINCIQTEE